MLYLKMHIVYLQAASLENKYPKVEKKSCNLIKHISSRDYFLQTQKKYLKVDMIINTSHFGILCEQQEIIGIVIGIYLKEKC